MAGITPGLDKDSLVGIPNIGVKSRQMQMLTSISVNSFGQLQKIGSVAAYVQVKRLSFNVSLNPQLGYRGRLDWATLARGFLPASYLAVAGTGNL